MNYAANEAPQDGTFLTIVSQSVPVVEATGGEGLRTSLGAFKWIGNFTRANNVTVTWAASNVKTPAGCDGAGRRDGCDRRRNLLGDGANPV